jgi:hypothetical protein
MTQGHHRRRVRVITDEARYHRHKRKKLLRRLVRVVVWVLALLVGLALFWLVLDRMMQPPPQQ